MRSQYSGKKQLRLHIWLIIMVLGLGLSSCATVSNPTAPDFSQANWQAEYQDILLVGDFGEKGGIELISENYPQDLSGEFNSVPVSVGDPQYDIYQDRWHTELQSTQLNYGASIEYQLSYSGKERQGVIRIPATPAMITPIFTSGDYHFEWTIDSPPDYYVSRFSYTYQTEFGEVAEQLGGSSLDHTLRSEDWGGTVVYPLHLSLTALNYERDGEGYIVVSGSSVTTSF